MLLDDKYWSTYILVKHMCEIVVLTLELIISTAIKPYDARAAPARSSASSGNSSSNSHIAAPGAGGAGAVPYTRAPVMPTMPTTNSAVAAAAVSGWGYGSLGATAATASADRRAGNGAAGRDDSEHGVTEMTPMLPPQRYVRAREDAV